MASPHNPSRSAAPISLRYLSGETPTTLPKTVVKWPWLQKPRSYAMSAMLAVVSFSMLKARSTRRRRTNWWGECPVDALKACEKWQGAISK